MNALAGRSRVRSFSAFVSAQLAGGPAVRRRLGRERERPLQGRERCKWAELHKRYMDRCCLPCPYVVQKYDGVDRAGRTFSVRRMDVGVRIVKEKSGLASDGDRGEPVLAMVVAGTCGGQDQRGIRRSGTNAARQGIRILVRRARGIASRREVLKAGESSEQGQTHSHIMCRVANMKGPWMHARRLIGCCYSWLCEWKHTRINGS